MSQSRLFSVLRRKAGVLDMMIPNRPGVNGFILKSAPNWDGSFTALSGFPAFISCEGGWIDADLRGAAHVIQGGDHTRVIFKPSNHGLSDTGPLWLQVACTRAGVEQTNGTDGPGAPTILFGVNDAPNAMQTIAGTTATLASLALSQQIDFQRSMENVRIRNNGTNDMSVAFNPEGPESTIKGNGGEFVGYSGTVSSLFVRTTTGTSAFTVTCTVAVPRLGEGWVRWHVPCQLPVPHGTLSAVHCWGPFPNGTGFGWCSRWHQLPVPAAGE